MNRTETIAEVVDDGTADDVLRPLTARECGLLDDSKADFEAGRTLTLAEARARTAVYLAERRAMRPQR